MTRFQHCTYMLCACALAAVMAMMVARVAPADHLDDRGAPAPHSVTCDEWIEWLVDGNREHQIVRVWRPFVDQIARDCLGREPEPDGRALLPWGERRAGGGGVSILGRDNPPVTVQDGGPAFPDTWKPGQPGMTLRDWFAGQALAGLCGDASRGGGFEVYAADAYRVRRRDAGRAGEGGMIASMVPVKGQPDRVALVMSFREARTLKNHLHQVAEQTDDVYENRPAVHGVATRAAVALSRAMATEENPA